MPSPFPGMDPYLEHPALWPDVHNAMIADLRGVLAPALRPRYVVRIEERTYVADSGGLAFIGRPDLAVEERGGGHVREATPPRSSGASGGVLTVQVPMPDLVRETYLEVRTVPRGRAVTVLEILSATNKLPGRGRRLYEKKRTLVLDSDTHLVEVDLLRVGRPMPVSGTDRRDDYRILVSRADERPDAELRLFSVRGPIPKFRLPLLPGDEEPDVDLGGVLSALYDRAAYDLSIDYRGEAVPPLAGEDRAFADEVLRALRSETPRG